ncbi:M23 family metallopeptidase [Sphingomonas sp. RT2P30]|uniref:M23 family metallopeptidase n=1 Tax=Parasphingomonas halimpatiens TaxID=3096162 RepID=UPI002FC81D67
MRRLCLRPSAALIVALLAGGCIPQNSRPEPYYPQDNPARDDSSQDRYEPRRIDEDVRTVPAAPPPAWQSRAVTPDARVIADSTYVVRPGDTLRHVADITGSGSEAIARANNLMQPFTIRAGERLAIPGGRYHLVRAGETGIAIARAYGVDWGRIIAANELSAPYVLRVGMRVLIPGGAAASGTATAAERAAAFRLDIDDIVTGSQPAIAEHQRPARPAQTASQPVSAFTPVQEPSSLRGGFAWPVRGRIVARFGPGASGERYNGIKIAVPTGTPITAAADGVVAYAGSEISNLGGLVIIKHGDGWTSVYGHASQLLVQRGQAVKRGQKIALSGDSGFADRPEVHFELRKGRLPVDPLVELPR